MSRSTEESTGPVMSKMPPTTMRPALTPEAAWLALAALPPPPPGADPVAAAAPVAVPTAAPAWLADTSAPGALEAARVPWG